MTFAERTTDPRRYRYWEGNVEADYVYTSGVAGEKFFRELRDHGRILGVRCRECGTQWLPPKQFCERCFHEIDTWVDAPPVGRVEAVAIVRVGIHGEPLPHPVVWALVRFTGFEGGFVHRFLVDPAKARAGVPVKAVLRPAGERAGAITDIEGFAPA